VALELDDRKAEDEASQDAEGAKNQSIVIEPVPDRIVSN